MLINYPPSQVMTSGPLELIEGAEGHKMVIHVNAPPDLICGKDCTIRVEVDIQDNNPLHCSKVSRWYITDPRSSSSLFQ